MGFSYSSKIFGGVGAGGSSLPDLSGNTGKVLTVNATEDGVEWAAGPAPAAAGSDTQVLFNDGGAIAGNAGLTFQKTSKALSTTGPLTISPTADVTAITARASADPGTAHIVQWQTSANGALGHIAHDGSISAPSLVLDTPLAVAEGGTGLAALGTALQVLRVNAGATALEYAAASGGITNSAGANVLTKSDGANLVASNLSDSGTAVTSAVPVLLPDGTAAAPALAFSADTALGFYRSGADSVRFSWSGNSGDWVGFTDSSITGQTNSGGTKYQLVHSSTTASIRMSSDSLLWWNSATNLGAGAKDTIVRRRGAANPAWGEAAANPTAATAYTHNLAADGTGTNWPGANATLLPGVGTGSGAASRLLLGGPLVGSTGSSAQSTATPVSIGGEVKADGTQGVLDVTATFPATVTASPSGATFSFTGAGSSAYEITGLKSVLNAGYTGVKATQALLGVNVSAGTANVIWGLGGKTWGNVGQMGYAGGTGNLYTGMIGFSSPDAAGKIGIGVAGYASYTNNNSTRIGGAFAANSVGGGIAVGVLGIVDATAGDPSNPSLVSAAALFDNNTVAVPVIVGRHNGTQVFSVNHEGGVNLMREVEANTAGVGAPNALAATESHKVLTNEGATALNYHTLPAAATGLTFTFYVQDADGMRVTAGTGDTIRIASNVTAAAGYIESTVIGSSVTLVAINADEWVAVAVVGSWVI